VLISWKLGKTCPSACSLKAECLAMWASLKTEETAATQPWTDADEAKLIEMKEKIDNILIDDTNLGRLKEQNK
jgi:hypothetical protein